MWSARMSDIFTELNMIVTFTVPVLIVGLIGALGKALYDWGWWPIACRCTAKTGRSDAATWQTLAEGWSLVEHDHVRLKRLAIDRVLCGATRALARLRRAVCFVCATALRSSFFRFMSLSSHISSTFTFVDQETCSLPCICFVQSMVRSERLQRSRSGTFRETQRGEMFPLCHSVSRRTLETLSREIPAMCKELMLEGHRRCQASSSARAKDCCLLIVHARLFPFVLCAFAFAFMFATHGWILFFQVFNTL